MNYLVYLFYPILAILLLKNAKFYGTNWNDDFLSLKQSKALQGFCAIGIIFHHMSQKTAASWLKDEYIIHGLDPFVSIGFLFVSVFFFFSGYGLIKSYKTKENYLNGFLSKHVLPIILALLTTTMCFLIGRSWMQIDFSMGNIFLIGEPNQVNPYAWYAVAIIIFYIVFYFSFKFAKSEKIAILFTCLGVILYMLYCDFAIFGTWWYNSVPAFIAGLLIAENEERIVNEAKKHYLFYLILFVVLTIALFFISLIDKNKVSRLVILFAQMACSISFVFSLLLIGLKVKIGNKALYFLGSFTLELYLLHGIFVQIFSYNFITERSFSPYYIDVLPLYVLVVLVLSIPLSFLLHFVHQAIIKFFKKQTKLAETMKKDAKRVAIIFAISFVFIIIFNSISSHNRSKNIVENYKKYEDSNITYLDVNGKKMAAFITGDGPHTIIMTGPMFPTLSYKPIAEFLAEKYKIIVLDFLGTGFSDVADSERTLENMVEELNLAIEKLNLSQKVILFSHTSTGPCIQMYANKYPQKVEAVIGMDTLISEQFFESNRANNINEKEYRRAGKRMAKVKKNLQKFGKATGLIDWSWAVYEGLFQKGWTDIEREILCELYKNTIFTENAYSQTICEYDNFTAVQNVSYPDDIPVLFLLGYDTISNHYFYGDWKQFHLNQFTSSPLCDLHVITGDPYGIYWNHRAIKEQIVSFINTL